MGSGEGQLLESWKEISGYLKRSVRTCRRWEAELGLPIHRLDGTPRARVFAYPAELDRWLGEKLHHIEAEEPATGFPAVLLKKKKKVFWAAGSVAAVVALGAGAAFLPPLLRLAPVPVPDKIPILTIFPFETPSGDKSLEDWRIALPELLITDLRQSRYLDVVPVRNLYARLMDMKLADAPRLSSDDVDAITKRFESDFLVTGRLERAGKGLSIEIALRPVKDPSRSPQTLHTTVGSEAELVSTADVLSREIKKGVGLTRREISGDIDAPLRRIATPSVEALKLYARAEWPREWRPYPDMVPALEKALAIDPEFGLAGELMYRAYGISRPEELVRWYERALAHPDRLSEREALLLRADFYLFYRSPRGYGKLAEAGLPEETVARLGPKTRSEVLPVLERLSTLYPGFFESPRHFATLVRIYMDAEDWDTAISVLEKVAPVTATRMRANAQTLIRCYLARGLIDKAEALIARCENVVSQGGLDSMRESVAMKKRLFDEAFKYIEKRFVELGRHPYPYAYHAQRGYILWLADDLAGAEKEHRAAVPDTGSDVEVQRATDLSAVHLSQGRIDEAIAEAGRGIEIAEKAGDPYLRGEARTLRYFRAYLYRLAGRLGEALRDAEAACRDYQSPDIPPGLAVALLHLRALITLDLGRADDFERDLEEIRAYCDKEGTPKFIRAVHHLRGLQELRRGRGQRAISELEHALDLSTPETSNNDQAPVLFALADACESVGNAWTAIVHFEEIAKPGERGSLSGDVYALSFYRKAKLYEARVSDRAMYGRDPERLKSAAEAYRKFLSLWGGADSHFAALLEDARKRLAALEAR